MRTVLSADDGPPKARNPGELRLHLERLKRAIGRGRSRKWCLRLWRQFILERDEHVCICCDSRRDLIAHHIFRKCILGAAEFQTGNGIALCRVCHAKVHSKWNGRPTPGEPLNARGGDDQDEIAFLYGALSETQSRTGLTDEFYFLGDDVLDLFKRYQGFPATPELSGSRVSQAHALWRSMPIPWYTKVAEWTLELLLAGDMGLDAATELGFFGRFGHASASGGDEEPASEDDV